jgi:hypothetical protein
MSAMATERGRNLARSIPLEQIPPRAAPTLVPYSYAKVPECLNRFTLGSPGLAFSAPKVLVVTDTL